MSTLALSLTGVYGGVHFVVDVPFLPDPELTVNKEQSKAESPYLTGLSEKKALLTSSALPEVLTAMSPSMMAAETIRRKRLRIQRSLSPRDIITNICIQSLW